MKLWLLALAAAAIVFPPFKAVDPGRLCVVETLVLAQTKDAYCIYGGEWSGKGETLSAALADMERTVPGKLFLRQVQRVIFCQSDALPVPEEVPMGAAVYRSGLDGESLWEDLKKLEPVMKEWEQEKELPRVSDLKREKSGGEEFVWKGKTK